MLAQSLLQLLEVSIQRQTATRTSRKERVDDYDFAFQEIAVEAHLLAVLIHEENIGEVVLRALLVLLLIRFLRQQRAARDE
jgi:hypothetical protein